MKKIKNKIILILILIIYFIFEELTGIGIPCPFHYFLGLYCPGCGVSRMLKEIAHFNFDKAFHHNMLLFILLPFGLFLFAESIISDIKGRKALYEKMPRIVWYILIVILILFGILRNIFPILAP